MMDDLMGVITFKAATYRKIADDKTLTMMAAIIVVVVSIIVGGVTALITSRNFLLVVVQLVVALIGWGLGGWLLAFVAKTFFQGKTDTGEMLRVTGFTYIFAVLGVIPIIGGLIGAILQIIGNIIGVREAAEFDTTKAILTSIIAGVIVFIVVAVITGILFVAVIGAAVATGGTQ
jgi:hypothetical protein